MPVSLQLESTEGHVSGESLDLLLIGALPPPVANVAKAHLDDCEVCRARWRELNEDKRRFEEHVYARTLPTVVARSGSYPQARQRWRPFAWLALGVAVLGALVGGFVALRARGAVKPSLEAYLVRPGQAPVLAGPGALVEPGDRLKLIVSPGRARYLLLAARDQGGHTEVYFPPGGRESARLEGPGRLAIERGVEPRAGEWTVLAIFSDGPVPAEALEGPPSPMDRGATVITQVLATNPR